jgi:YidC/Oxa1 family membrane protein insertase
VDFGFWGFLSKPLFLWLHWTYDHMVPNWGWSILILTLIINIAVLPLRITSMKSALKMQKIQPQVAAIREKYKKFKMGDPRQADMNRELAPLQSRRREHVRRMPADAHPVPAADCVLLHAGQGN